MTVTGEPSVTGLGETESDTCGSSSSRIVTSIEAGEPCANPLGKAPSATVNLSSSASVSYAVVIWPVLLSAFAAIVMLASDP